MSLGVEERDAIAAFAMALTQVFRRGAFARLFTFHASGLLQRELTEAFRRD